jgi:ribonucleoside-triphosphate reductase
MTDNESAAVQPGGEVRRIKCEIYSRVCGYLTPISAWNVGKRQEFSERKYFDAVPDFSMEPDEQLQSL